MNNGILAVWNDCAAGYEAEYESWYQSEHLPERVGVPGFIRGRRYAALDAPHQFFTYYEVQSPDVLTSDAYRSRLESPTETTREIMSGVFINMTRAVCRCVYREGRFRGAYAITVSGLKPDTARAMIDAQMALPGTARAEYWQAVSDVSELSAEQRLRGVDQSIDTCLFVEVLRADDLSQGKAALSAGGAASVMTYALLTELEH